MLDTRGQFGIATVDTHVVATALDLAATHRLQYWDSVIIGAAIAAGCELLLSEDMQHGSITGGLTIVNPLAEPMHPKLAAVVSG